VFKIPLFKTILFILLLVIIGIIWYFNFYKGKKKAKTTGYVWVGEGPDPFSKKEEKKE